MVLKVLIKSVRLLIDNFQAALRVSLVLFLVVAICESALIYGLAPMMPQTISVFVVAIVLQIVIFAWIAIGWHRYILLAEMPVGSMPEMNWGRLLSYIKCSIWVIVVIVAILLPVFVIVFAATYQGVPIPFVESAIMSACVIVMQVLFYRFGLALPDRAIGGAMSLWESWDKTRGLTLPLLGLSILISLFFWIVDQTDALGLPLVLEIVLYWVTYCVTMMLSVSVLTTLYGHLVEGRPLD